MNTQSDLVSSVEVYLVNLQQETPYLGSLREGETVNDQGYFVRRGNRTVYPRVNRSLVVRLTTKDGAEGWGETYGLVAPKATAEIINDLLSGFVVGRHPNDRETLHDELYDLMRVRGYTGGFYLDALAAIDIALWDVAGKLQQQSVAELIGPKLRDSIPAYVSGLPKDTLAQRCDLALQWKNRGFNDFKFAMPVADEGPVKELAMLRHELGDHARIAADLHWAYSASQAIELAKELSPHRPWFLEAPVAPEDVDALSVVASGSNETIAVGEEWRTHFDARSRIERGAVDIVQPEMGHTGITQFLRIARIAAQHNVSIIPHATIGSGVFLAASLQVSLALPGIVSHEFQHSVFDPFQEYTGRAMQCEAGRYRVPDAPGIGVEPSETMWNNMTRIR